MVVIIAALDGTFEQKPFPNIANLIPHAESVVKLTSVCMSCLKQAAFTRRLDETDKRVEVIGHNDIYAASCRRCLLLPVSVIKAQIESRATLKESLSMDSIQDVLDNNGEHIVNHEEDMCTDAKVQRKLCS